MGGEITLKSKLGEGSELSFVLPFKRVMNVEPAEDTLLCDVSLCVIGQRLTSSFIDTVNSMSGQLHIFDSLSQFCQLQLPDTIKGYIVLLVDEETFTRENNGGSLSLCKEKISLLGLCQPVMTPLSQSASTYLDELDLPYLLLDLPLFRFSLRQIHQAIINPAKASILSDKDSGNVLNDNNLGLLSSLSVKQNKIENEHESIESKVVTKNNLAGINVLLVEDNLVNQLVAKELLLNLQAHVVIADNGQCALDILDECSFDVVLMDIQMPIMDGLTATKQIRAQAKYRTLPVIAMTAHARAEDESNSLAAGMNLHMSKPVTEKVLLESIKQVLIK
jgi:CheY-like chemotaxis protein